MIPLRAFFIAFRTSPRAAFAALWALLFGRRVRARNIIFAAAHKAPRYYPLWTAVIEPRKMEAYCAKVPAPTEHPPVLALVFGGQGASLKSLQRTVASLRDAFGGAVTICSDLPCSDRLGCRELRGNRLGNLAAIATAGTWLLPMIAGDRVARWTGAALSVALVSAGAPDMIFWDEDRIDGGKRADPWLKPEWDEMLFLARDFVTGAGVVNAAALSNSEAELPLTRQGLSTTVASVVTRSRGRPRAAHIPLILSHRTAASIFATASERKEIVQSMWHQPVELKEIEAIPDALRPRFRARGSLPKVSILIPTRNRHDLLRRCVDGVLGLDYAGPIEIIVIDNDSEDPATVDYLERLCSDGLTVLRHPGPFNFSAMNNRAAASASGEILCLLNNDVEMDDGTWLEPMVRHAMRPGVGAVGALLKYPDGTVQHAGISIGTGDAAGHVHRGIAIADAGHRYMHRLTREVSAVTAACMVIRKDTFLEVGGFDENDLKVAFNDVDLCLRLTERGYRNIFAGEACLTHHESKSRGSDFSDANHNRYQHELAHLQSRWKTKGFVDPYSHPLAMRSSEKFVLGP